MADDRLLAGLASFDRPAAPDVTFSETLFESLATDLGWRAAPRGLGGRIRHALGLERPPIGGTALRLAWLALLLVALVALAGAAALVGQQLLPVSPEELIRRSQAVYDHPPAFAMTVTDSEHLTVELASDGSGTWRIEYLASGEVPSGSVELWDGARHGRYDAATGFWTVDTSTMPPYPLAGEFALRVPAESTTPARPLSCEGGQWLEPGTVAGRSVDHVLCPAGGLHLWIDQATGLVLALEATADAEDWSPGYRIEATSLVVAPPEDATAFAWEGPPDAVEPGLPVGQPLPAWSGMSLAGETVDLGAVTGPAVIHVWAPWCLPCTGAPLDALAEVARQHPGVTTVTVGQDSTEALAGTLAEQDLDLETLTDADGSLLVAWRLDAVPTTVLVDAKGTVALVQRGPLTATDLEAMYAALEAGGPPPAPSPVPSDPGGASSPTG
jgi:hypothetical protein